MTPFQRTQEILDKVLPVPVNLPKIYLLGDAGAGKTTIIRQMLGTTELRFPSVRRTRTTIAVTEYVVSKEPSFKAAVVFKPVEEIERYIKEILEDAIIKGYKAFKTQQLNEDDLIAYLEESPDQRFRLKFMVNEASRRVIAKELSENLFPKLSVWINNNFPNESDDNTAIVIDLALGDGLRTDIKAVEEKIFEIIKNKVSNVCSQLLYPHAEHYEFENSDLNTFVKMIKPLLDAEEGSISPVIERARIRGNIIASWLPNDIEFVFIDGEGIGHDIREAGKSILSSRHFDYFYTSDSIMLVEDSERSFIGGGKSAIVALAKHGYLSKTSIVFSKLDKIDGQRPEQIQEVNRGLRNLINAISEDDETSINQDKIDVHYVAQMNLDEPDEDTKNEIRNLLQQIKTDAQKVKPAFVRPQYDFELLAPFLDKATTDFRQLWDKYLSNESSYRKPWQTVKAFNYRMTWGQDDYKDMKPIADLHNELLTKLEKYIISPTMWEQEVTTMLQQVSIELFKREVSNSLVQLIREIFIYQNDLRWKKAAELRGAGSTRERAAEIMSLIYETVPSMTDDHAKKFKDSVKECFLNALKKI